MRISDWSSDVCSSDLSSTRSGLPPAWRRRNHPSPSRPVPAGLLTSPTPPHEDTSARRPEARRRNVNHQEHRAQVPDVRFSADRKSGVEGKSVSIRVDLGGRRIIQKKKQETKRK